MTTLTFTLSPSSTARLSSALTCLSKFSDHILLTSQRHILTLSALNSSKSAFASIDLLASKFFDTYTFHPAPGSQPARFSCKLQTKPLLSVFRQKLAAPHPDTATVEHCDFTLHEDPASAECRLHIRIACKNGVVKTHRLTYEDADAPAPLFDHDSARNRWVLAASLLRAYMEHFGPRAEQLQISSGGGRAAFTSYTEKLLDNKEILKHPLQTSVSLDTEDFEEFACDDGLCVAVALKDVKALTHHADSLGVPVSACYSDPGRPMQLRYGKDGMECTYTLMTIGDVRGTQRAVVSRPPPRETTRAPSEVPAPSAAGQQQGDAEADAGMGAVETGETDVPPPRSWPGQGPQPSAPQPAATPRIRPPQQRKPSPPLPERKETVDGALFLNYDETESEEEEAAGDIGAGELLWDTTGRGEERAVARDASDLGMRETEAEEGVGPTQQERIRGLFD